MTDNYAAIMFADVSGSSKLFKQEGDARARSIIARVVEMMSKTTQASGGRVIKTIGDEVMAAFDDAQSAANAAMMMQEDIHREDYGAPLTLRIGFHYGPIITEGGDIFGEAVNDAAALVKEAKGSQILLSDVTRNALPDDLKEQSPYFDDLRLKGGNAVSAIHLLKWEDDEGGDIATQFVAAITPEMLDQKNVFDELTLIYAGKAIDIHKEDVPFSIGRGKTTDLTVKYRSASREHCTIDYRRGKFVLIDKSTNGTFVKPDGRAAIYLRREETPLMANGVISFAADGSVVDGPHLLHFLLQENE